MRRQAIETVRQRGGDVSDKTEVLSEYILQFGAFRGQTFSWILENGLGYAGYLVDSMRNETVTSSPLSQNKASFKAYAELFQECKIVIEKKKADRERREKQLSCAVTTTPATIRTVMSNTASSLAPLILGKSSAARLSAKIAAIPNQTRFTPNISGSSPVQTSKPTELNTSSDEIADEEMCWIGDRVEQELGIKLVSVLC